MNDLTRQEISVEKSAFASDGSDEDIRKAYVHQQILDRRRDADRLLKRARELLSDLRHPKARAQAEENARRALKLYRSSLDWAEDTEHEDEAHRLMDLAGRWVRESFGCRLARKGKTYQQTCPVALGHNRIGLSVGGRAKSRQCSLCGMDISECDHLPGTAYMVPGGSDDLGWCRVCLDTSCEHKSNLTYRASVVSIIHEMELEEVSLVSRPAHPEARIHSISVSVSELRNQLGDAFVPGVEVSCDRCLSPCDGLIRHDVLHGDPQ